MAKLKATEMLAFVADEAIQIHGGMGLMERPAAGAHLARRARRAHLGGHLRDPAPHHLAAPCCGPLGVADVLPCAAISHPPALTPASIAFIGGSECDVAIGRTRELGFTGKI